MLLLNDDTELFFRNGSPTDNVKPYFQAGTLAENVTLANNWHTAREDLNLGRTRVQAFLKWIVQYDNHNNMAPKLERI